MKGENNSYRALAAMKNSVVSGQLENSTSAMSVDMERKVLPRHNHCHSHWVKHGSRKHVLMDSCILGLSMECK